MGLLWQLSFMLCQICIVKLCQCRTPIVHLAIQCLVRQYEILCTSNKCLSLLESCKLQTWHYCDDKLWCAIWIFCMCHMICFGVHNEWLYVICNMLWCAEWMIVQAMLTCCVVMNLLELPELYLKMSLSAHSSKHNSTKTLPLHLYFNLIVI